MNAKQRALLGFIERQGKPVSRSALALAFLRPRGYGGFVWTTRMLTQNLNKLEALGYITSYQRRANGVNKGPIPTWFKVT